MSNNKVFKFPNALIRNEHNLHPSTIAVALVIYGKMNKHRLFTNSQKNIAKMAKCCDTTVRQAMKELESCGFLSTIPNYHYDTKMGRKIYDQTTYMVKNAVLEDYTFVPYLWLRYTISPSTMQVLLICRSYMRVGSYRVYPSRSKLQAISRLAKSTVGTAIRIIKELGILVIQQCRKKDGGFTSNSYYMVHEIEQKQAEACATNTNQLFIIKWNKATTPSPTALLSYQKKPAFTRAM